MPPAFRPTTIPASATAGAASTRSRRSPAGRAVAPTTPARPIPAPASRATRRLPSVTAPPARAARGAAATRPTRPRATTTTLAPTATRAAAACAAASPSCATRPTPTPVETRTRRPCTIASDGARPEPAATRSTTSAVPPAAPTAPAIRPAGRSMTSNSNQSLYSVWGTSASSVWAVGQRRDRALLRRHPLASPTDATGGAERHADVAERHRRQQRLCGRHAGHHRRHRNERHPFRRHELELPRPPHDRRPVLCGLRGAPTPTTTPSCGAASRGATTRASLYRVTNGVATLVMTVPAAVLPEPEPVRDPCLFADRHRGHGAHPGLSDRQRRKNGDSPSAARLNSQTGALWAASTNDLFVTFGAERPAVDRGPELDQPHHRPQRPLVAISGTAGNRVFAARSGVLAPE